MASKKVSARAYGKKHGVSSVRVRQWISEGRLSTAERVDFPGGFVWLVDPREARPGRAPKGSLSAGERPRAKTRKRARRGG